MFLLLFYVIINFANYLRNWQQLLTTFNCGFGLSSSLSLPASVQPKKNNKTEKYKMENAWCFFMTINFKMKV